MNGFVPARLSYKSFLPSGGADEKLNPIIFIHGMLLSKASWNDIPQIIANKTKRKTYAYDVRNHGDSQHTDEFNFDLNVEDLFHLMDSLNIPKAVLVGHSMGGYAIIRAALRKPERVESIFVEDMFVRRIPAHIQKDSLGFAEMMKTCLKNVPKNVSELEATKYVIDRLFENYPPDSPIGKEKDVLMKTNWDFKHCDDGGYDVKFNINALRRALENSENIMSDPCGKYEGPAYFLHGALSILAVSSEEEHIKKFFPNAVLIEFEGVAHNLHTESPEKFIENIVCFL